MKSLIQKLVETPGPSGYESQIRDVVRAEIEPLVDETRVDNLGNLIARFGKAAPDGLRLMLSAHIDEIGMMITHVDERGYARFTTIGGVRRHTLPGSRVRFLDGRQGVVGNERLKSVNETPAVEQMYIDMGADTRESCGLRVGDVAVFERPFLDLGARWVSKAMDDRIGVAVMIEAVRQMRAKNIESPHEIYFVFSVQEEVGVRGATTAAYGIDPELGLALDVTPTGDTPKGPRLDVGLGKGPAVKIRDRGMLADPRVVDWMVKTAEAAKLPYQLEILEIGGTDARAIQLNRAGVPAGCLSIPCRHVHTPSEMVDCDDVEKAVQLLIELVSKPVNFSR